MYAVLMLHVGGIRHIEQMVMGLVLYYFKNVERMTYLVDMKVYVSETLISRDKLRWLCSFGPY